MHLARDQLRRRRHGCTHFALQRLQLHSQFADPGHKIPTIRVQPRTQRRKIRLLHGCTNLGKHVRPLMRNGFHSCSVRMGHRTRYLRMCLNRHGILEIEVQTSRLNTQDKTPSNGSEILLPRLYIKIRPRCCQISIHRASS